MNERLYYLGFSLFPGIGSVLFAKLLQQFGSAKAAWKSPESAFEKVVGAKLTEKFVAFKSSTDLADEYAKCVQQGIQLVTLADKTYPLLLAKIPHPPFLLYVKGDTAVFSLPKSIGVVGTRKMTPYGRQVTEMLTNELAAQGFTIVSGLALGVDALSHMVTIRAQGKTIAVLGCGVDCCYPRANQKIYDEILATGGVIVSMFPPGMEATKGSFPARNALIAGLSLGVVVTEGAAHSGSLITASFAKKFDRPVFAVPGPITSHLSKGANSLLKNGAIPVTDVKDILDRLGIITKVKGENLKGKGLKGLTGDEQEVFRLLQNGPLHFDQIVRTIGKDSKTIGSLLSLMELSGLIYQEGGKYYI